MMLPYSWFSITITKTCEKAGTTAGVGGGVGLGVVVGAGWLVAGVAAGVAVACGGVGVANASRWACRSLTPLKSAGNSTWLLVPVDVFEVVRRLFSTSAVGIASRMPAATTISALFRLTHRMTRLTRSTQAILRIGRCVPQRESESICHP